MEGDKLNQYEGMFLVDNATATDEWDDLVNHIHDVLTKHGSEVVSTQKWAENKLAYKIGNHTRATYVLVKFNAPGSSIVKIRKEFVLSDKIIRSLIVRDDKYEHQEVDESAVDADSEIDTESVDGLQPVSVSASDTKDEKQEEPVVADNSQGDVEKDRNE
ncbi:MAG: 30S ribosomal protein S6 [Candidatus Anammoxibacter sp.]